MKKLLVAGIAAAAFLSAPALAAPPTPFNWTGFYVGGQVGWESVHNEHCAIGSPCPGIGVPYNISGWLGGATLGYNLQWTNWVLGVEGDWSWGDIKGSSPSVGAFHCTPICSSSLKDVGTVRGRVGYVFDRLLPYLTAGAAFSSLEAALGVPPNRADSTTMKTYFIWGGGVEYAFSPNWSTKIEYLRSENVGNFVYDTGGVCGVGTNCYLRVNHYDLVRIGLNYRFGSR